MKMDTVFRHRTGVGIVLALVLLSGILRVRSAVGPFPPGVGIWKTAIACEKQKIYIICPSIYSIIEIGETMFGRKNPKICLPPGKYPETSCQEQEFGVKGVVLQMCDSVRNCEVSATNTFLAKTGTVICPKVSKYLQIKYRCVPRGSIHDDSTPYEPVNSVTESVAGVLGGGAISSVSGAVSSGTSISGGATSGTSIYGGVNSGGVTSGTRISGGFNPGADTSGISTISGGMNSGAIVSAEGVSAGLATSGTTTSGETITDTTLLPAEVPMNKVVTGSVSSSHSVETGKGSSASASSLENSAEAAVQAGAKANYGKGRTGYNNINALANSYGSNDEVEALLKSEDNPSKHDSLAKVQGVILSQSPQVVTETMPLLREVVGKRSDIPRAPEGFWEYLRGGRTLQFPEARLIGETGSELGPRRDAEETGPEFEGANASRENDDVEGYEYNGDLDLDDSDLDSI